MKLIFFLDGSGPYRDLIYGGHLTRLLEETDWNVVLGVLDELPFHEEDLQPHPRLKFRRVSKHRAGVFSTFTYLLDKWVHKLGRDLIVIDHPDSTIAAVQRNRYAEFGKDLQSRSLPARFLHLLGLRWFHLSRLALRWGAYPEIAALLEEEQPDAVVYSNIRVGQMDCLREAKRRGIPVILDNISWDNPTSKGAILLIPDHVLVWSKRMKEEMLSVHSLPEEAVTVTGGLCWDPYSRPSYAGEREAFCRELGIDPEDKIILYALARPATIPCQVDFLHLLCRLLDEEAFGHPCHVIARVNPVDITEFDSRDLSHPRLTVQHPSGFIEPATGKWRADRHFVPELLRTLDCCDVVLTVQSSMLIDGSIRGKPVVNIGYDAGQERPYHHSVRRVFEFAHARSVLEFDPTYIVKDEVELVRSIRRAFEQPTEKAQQQAAFVREVCGKTDGLNGGRWLEALRNLEEQWSAGTLPEPR